jgi:nucleoside-diphosphate-sugar epimerase
MNVFLAGATGVLGRRLVRLLRERGHRVVGLVRDADAERKIAALGGEPCRANLFDRAALAQAAQGSDVVIHAATAIPTKPRTSLADWQPNDRIRREGTEALANCAAQVGARLLVFRSIVWAVAPRDGTPCDEDSPPCTDAQTQSAWDGEQIARQAGAGHDFDVSIVRCGAFYGSDSGHTRMMGQGLAQRRMPIIGSGENYWHNLHLDDAASGFAAVAEAGRTGTWHLVDDEPVKVADLFNDFAARLDARPPRQVPKWLARLLAGKLTVDFVTRSTRTSNARMKRDFNWTPKYPTYREGLAEVIAEWQGRTPG